MQGLLARLVLAGAIEPAVSNEAGGPSWGRGDCRPHALPIRSLDLRRKPTAMVAEQV